MSINVTSSLFYDGFTGIPGGGVSYFPGNYLDQISHIIYFEVAWNFTDAKFYFDSATKTITAINRIDQRDFKKQGFKTSDNITAVGSSLNDGDLTISAISEDGKTITVAESLVDETCESCSIHGTTPITGIDFYWNLVKNGSQENYFSLTDSQTKQRFIASGLDATDSTPINMVVGTKSFGWVINDITNRITGETDEVKIYGEGISDYKQKFKITQIVRTTPVFLTGQINNFINGTTPEYWQNESGLKYICSLQAKFNANSPTIDHSGGITDIDGLNAWTDQGKGGLRPEYKIESVSYENTADSSSMDRLDVDKDVLVTLTISSRSGKFIDGGTVDGTKMVLVFSTCPTAESDYQNTETTLLENFYVDFALDYLGAAAVNGSNYGTSRQAIVDAQMVYASPDSAIATFTFSAGSDLKNFWKSKADGDRYYSITITTQDRSIAATSESDRVTCRAPFESADWDRKDDTLSSLTRTGIENYKYPDQALIPVGDVAGMEGEKWISELAFKVNKEADGEGNTPTLKDFTFQILAVKTGETDFVLEEKKIIASGYRKLIGVQDIDFEDTRGFIGADDDIYDSVFLLRDPDNDTATESAYLAHYGYVLRYEHWIDALNQFQIFNAGAVSPVSKYIDEVTQRWSNYNSVEGWSLIFKFSWNVTKDSIDTPFWITCPITVIESETNNWPSGYGTLTQSLEYFIWDDVNEVQGDDISMIRDDGNKITLIRATYTGNYALPIGATNWHGMLFANFAGGNIFDRRTASTSLDSETGSPFTATPENLLATYSFASANARINIFLNDGDPSIVESIQVESLFDSSFYDGLVEDIQIYSNLGLLYTSGSSSSYS